MKGIKLIMLTLLILSACNRNDTPKDLIDQKKMILIMADLHVMDGYMATMIYSDSLRAGSKSYYAAIYRNHNTSQALYEKSLRYYSMQPVLLDTMYTRVEAILAEKEHKINNAQIKKPNKPQKPK